jgi:homeobox protein CDX1/4
MVSFYNHFAMYQKNHSANLPYSASPSWYAGNYHHQPPNAQYMGDSDTPPQPVYYPHPHVFHQSSPDWAGHENFAVPPQSSLLQSTNGLHLNQNGEHLTDGLHSIPSPPITVSGSDMSSPGAPNGSASPHINARPTPVKSPYEWMKKPSYQTQPNPGKNFLLVTILCLCWNF